MSAAIRNALSLALIAAICTALVAVTYTLTDERIEENRQRYLEQNLAPALSGIFYDNALTESVVTLQPPHKLPGNVPAHIYRVYSGERPVAALLAVTARGGYSGPIRVLIGIDYDGTVSGIRILEHRETPGLGDAIEHDKSDWVEQFVGRSIGDPDLEQWKIRRDGGTFDQLTGASVTPRAVIDAIAETLVFFGDHRDWIFGLPPGTHAGATDGDDDE